MHRSDTLTATLDAIFGRLRTDGRPTTDQYFASIAQIVATRSTCPRAQVGCVLVRDGYQLVSGYNGAPRHQAHCFDVGCLMENNHCVRALHAEQNAIIQAAYEGVSIRGATVYVTHRPCVLCANMLINLEVKRIVYLKEYAPFDNGEFLKIAGVNVERIEL